MTQCRCSKAANIGRNGHDSDSSCTFCWTPTAADLISLDARTKGYTVTEVCVTEGKLAIEVQGWDKLWSMTSRLEVPLEHVVNVRPADDPVRGLRMLGTCVPGVITAGTFLEDGSRVFWNVHDPAKAIAVDLRDEQYSKLIIEVADPAATIKAFRRTLSRR